MTLANRDEGIKYIVGVYEHTVRVEMQGECRKRPQLLEQGGFQGQAIVYLVQRQVPRRGRGELHLMLLR